MTAVDDLLANIFDGLQPGFMGEFRSEFASWVRDSRRFREFAGGNRSKIRAKLKSARDEGGLLDVRAELQTALLLLGEERFTLEYEAYAAAKQRGPDYTVTFKTHTPFNVEVRRIRAADLGAADHAQRGQHCAGRCPERQARTHGQVDGCAVRQGRADAAKHRQPAVAGSRRGTGRLGYHQCISSAAPAGRTQGDDFFVRRGFTNTGDFLKQYGRLSGIVVRQDSETVVWLNGLARHKPPREVVTAIERLARP